MTATTRSTPDLNALIEKAREVALKSVQIDDGYTYSVPAHDLVEYSEVIKSLLGVIGSPPDLNPHWMDEEA